MNYWILIFYWIIAGYIIFDSHPFLMNPVFETFMSFLFGGFILPAKLIKICIHFIRGCFYD